MSALPRSTRSTRTSAPFSIFRSADVKAARARRTQRSSPCTSKRSRRASRSRFPPTIPASRDASNRSDPGVTNAVNSNGFAVNGLASTPYNLAVGGTDFIDLSSSTAALYWNTTNQSGTLASAKSHIPEMVWNDSCANPVFASAYGTGDAIAFCNTTTVRDPEQSVHRHLRRGQRTQQLHDDERQG